MKRKAARGRWDRLEPVKELAFRRRAELSHLNRTAAVAEMEKEILAAAREAREPLSGTNPSRTILKWLKEAGID